MYWYRTSGASGISYTYRMSAIDLYNLFRRIPNATEAEARAAADTIAHTDDFATKDDLSEFTTKADLKAGLAGLKAELKADLAELENRLTKWIVFANGIVIAILGLIIRL